MLGIALTGGVQGILLVGAIVEARKRLRGAQTIQRVGVRPPGPKCPDCGTLLVGSPAYCPRCTRPEDIPQW